MHEEFILHLCLVIYAGLFSIIWMMIIIIYLKH
jgi:hypothetical protein